MFLFHRSLSAMSTKSMGRQRSHWDTNCNSIDLKSNRLWRVINSYSFFRREKNVDDRAIDDFFREISALVRPKHYEMTNNVMRVWKILEAMNYTTARILYDSRQPCDILVRNCTWMNRPFDCMQYFERIQTSKGFCCSFHYKALDNFKK